MPCLHSSHLTQKPHQTIHGSFQKFRALIRTPSSRSFMRRTPQTTPNSWQRVCYSNLGSWGVPTCCQLARNCKTSCPCPPARRPQQGRWGNCGGSRLHEELQIANIKCRALDNAILHAKTELTVRSHIQCLGFGLFKEHCLDVLGVLG